MRWSLFVVFFSARHGDIDYHTIEDLRRVVQRVNQRINQAMATEPLQVHKINCTAQQKNVQCLIKCMSLIQCGGL